MAIYHLTAKVISRARGQSVVAAAAYRFGAPLKDERYGTTHRFSRGEGVAHAEIMTPGETPAWVRDREKLWNRVEAGERRKDAQLARVIEIGLPVELSLAENLALVREFVSTEFVSQGMVADLCIRTDDANPQAHILLTLRRLRPAGFGLKERRWNGKAALQRWRAAWADLANAHLARAGHHARVDHRTLEAQNIELTPARRLGIPRERGGEGTLPTHLRDRFVEQERVAKANGEAILEDPTVVLRSLTQHQAIFTRRDLTRFLRSHTSGVAQFEAAEQRVIECPDLVVLEAPAHGEPSSDAEARFTSREMLEAEKSLLRRVVAMAGRRAHGLAPQGSPMLDYLLADGDAKAVVLAAGAEKAALLAAGARAWQSAGFRVLGAARSARDADSLRAATEIEWQTVGAREQALPRGGAPFSRETLLLIDGAEMIGLRQLERWVGIADQARCKIVLVADAAQLCAMKTESPFAQVLRRIGGCGVRL